MTISNGVCDFVEWQGLEAVFSCRATGVGNIDMTCFLSNKPDSTCQVGGQGGPVATPTHSELPESTISIASECTQRSVADCAFGAACEYCPTCGSPGNTFEANPKFSSGYTPPGLCVTAGECSQQDKYTCKVNECGATCDKDIIDSCLGYQTCALTTSCGCEDLGCTPTEIGQHASHSGDPGNDYICAGNIGSQAWIISTAVQAENQYSCADGKDNDGNGLTDCADLSCNGINGPGNALCCNGASAQQTCGVLDVACTLENIPEFGQVSSCLDDNTNRGQSVSYSCQANTCQANAPQACDIECSNNGCCVPGQTSCAQEGELAQIDGFQDICSQGNWVGSECTLTGCTSTDPTNFECLEPAHCQGSIPGNCGEVTCNSFLCGTQRATPTIAVCEAVKTTQGYECAEVYQDPLEACLEEPTNPGEFNCNFAGEPDLCSNTHPLGYDAGCSGNFLCDVDLCGISPGACSLCYTQCSNAVADPTLAPSDISSCNDLAQNDYWENTNICGGIQ